MTIQVEFPDEILLASRQSRDIFVRNAMIYTLGHLYQQGKISSGFAAQVLACNRIEVYRLFNENGFSVIDYPEEEYQLEVQASRDMVLGMNIK